MTSIERARLSLAGLSVGDAFGQTFFVSDEVFQERIANRQTSSATWYLTDDSIQALALVEILAEFGQLQTESFAQRLGDYYVRNPLRGYGGTAHRILRQLHDGADWRVVAPSVFAGMGSYGNGAAMRIAPLGAYWADDWSRLVTEADQSAAVTHAHPEGRAGAVAVALAAAWAWQRRVGQTDSTLFEAILPLVPVSETQRRLERAAEWPDDLDSLVAAAWLGNGIPLSAADTVPFALWCAAQFAHDYPEALWQAVRAGGDRDTICAIVGGIVALAADPDQGQRGIPSAWLAQREALDDWQAAQIDDANDAE